ERGADVVVELEGDLDLRRALGTDLLGVLLAQEARRVERLVLGASRRAQREGQKQKAFAYHDAFNITGRDSAGSVRWAGAARGGADPRGRAPRKRLERRGAGGC